MLLVRFIFVVSMIVALGCVPAHVPKQFCASTTDVASIASRLDPEGHLQSREVPGDLRRATLRYLRGEICGQPPCDLFPDKADVKACEEGHMLTGWILHKMVTVDEVLVAPTPGTDAVVYAKAPRGDDAFVVVFRRSKEGLWLLFSPLWKVGAGVP